MIPNRSVEGAVQKCASCETALAGEYCHSCGQRRLDGRLTVRSFTADVARRVFRFDKALLHTFAGMLRQPGRLVDDYIAGRRAGILDPLQYFISSVFVQIVIAALVRLLAPIIDRTSALGWLGRLGGIVALKIFAILWMATIWRLVFRPKRYNLAEIYVFATYVFGTTGVLWALLPVIDLAVPAPLGADPLTVSIVTLCVEVFYATYAVAQFGRKSVIVSFASVSTVLTVGYGLLALLVGLEETVLLLLPPMPPS